MPGFRLRPLRGRKAFLRRKNEMARTYWDSRTRISRRAALAATGTSAVAAALLAACGSGSKSTGNSSGGNKSDLIVKPVDTSKQAKRDGIIKDRMPSDPSTLDIFARNQPLNPANIHAYSTLVQFKPGYLKPAENEPTPDIAESWEIAPDGLTVTLKLRQGIKFHNKAPVNGRAMDMDDILFSWDRFARKSSTRAGIANVADPGAPVLSLTAADARTVVMKLKEPLVYVLSLFCSNSSGGVIVLPKETDGAFDIRSDMIGTGPFFMANYTPSVGFTYKRFAEHWDKDYALAEQVELPIISEYASALAQLKAGNIHSMGSHSSTMGVAQEDILAVKKEEPRLNVYQGDLRGSGAVGSVLSFGWLPAGKSPFLDERVRQAVSMAIDRDLYLETFFNLSSFASQGLPLETRWNTALAASQEGWWLDPKGKDFGPNGKFFRFDVAEAKKLLAAAGYPNGIQDVVSSYGNDPALGPTPKHATILDGMIREAGIVSKAHLVDYVKEYMPIYRDGQGQFEGWTYISTAGGIATGESVGPIANEYWSKGGAASFHGFSSNGKGDKSGDPQVDSLIEKARVEQDVEKRKSLIFEVQRYLAKAIYAVNSPGVAAGFTMAWPALANFRVFQGSRLNYGLWVDQTKAPFRSG